MLTTVLAEQELGAPLFIGDETEAQGGTRFPETGRPGRPSARLRLVGPLKENAAFERERD